MKECNFKRIMRLFKNTDPLLYRHIYTQAKRYESLDDFIVDYNDLIQELRRRQKRMDSWFCD